MVFYYKTIDGHLVYKGKDKYQNQLLIKYALPQDVWFHADNYSSAHVYIRMNKGETWDTIDQKNIQQLCQLTKQNSIQGSKRNKIDIIYTLARNLLKTNDMEVGAVGYKDSKQVKKVREVTKDKMILKQIQKTQEWIEKDLQQQLRNYQLQESRQKHKQYKEQQRLRRLQQQKRKLQQLAKDYSLMNVEEYKTSNRQFNEDDFM